MSLTIAGRVGPCREKRTAATGDYSRGVGLADDTQFPTGWKSGHGARQTFVPDYYRHARVGKLVHAHG